MANLPDFKNLCISFCGYSASMLFISSERYGLFFNWRSTLRFETTFGNWNKPFKNDEKIFYLKSSFRSEDIEIFVLVKYKDDLIRKG